VRSYAIVLIFLEGRVLMAIPAPARGGLDSVVLVNWGCLAITLVVTECVLRWPALFHRSLSEARTVQIGTETL